MPVALPNVFVLGAQKCATTWIHHALREHPQVFVPAEDEIHYFDIHYHRGEEWYGRFYRDYSGQTLAADTTSSYIRDPRTPSRLARHNPEAKLIVCVRNPIERAFSHYWHEKKKAKIAFAFEELFTNYDLFESWLATGFYSQHLQRLYNHFPGQQVLVLVFDDLQSDAQGFCDQICRFLGVDLFVPSVIRERVNRAWSQAIQPPAAPGRLERLLRPIWRTLPVGVRARVKRVLRPAPAPASPGEYERGMLPETRRALVDVYRDEVRQFSVMLGRDLSGWLATPGEAESCEAESNAPPHVRRSPASLGAIG